MKTYILNVQAVDYGVVEIEVENEKEAKEKAYEAELEGKVFWQSREIKSITVEACNCAECNGIPF